MLLPVRSARTAAMRVLSGESSRMRVDESVTEVVGEVEHIGVEDLAVGVGQPHVAFGMQPLGLLVVDDLVGLERGAGIVDLHAADGGHPLVGVVVLDLVRRHQHLRVRVGPLLLQDLGRRARRRSPRRRAEELRIGRGGVEPAAERRHQYSREPGGPHGPPRSRRKPGEDVAHHPSSMNNKARIPVRPPVNTGNHAAATGCINSALLMSSDTFDRT